MKKGEKTAGGLFADLTDHEMKQITGGSFWEKLLAPLTGLGIAAFYDMGKEEGRMARSRLKLN